MLNLKSAKALGLTVPPSLLARRKMGFGIPLVHWFRSDLYGYVRDVLFSRRSLERGFFNQLSIERLLAAHQHGLADSSATIWQLLVFEHWCRHYLDTATVPEPSVASRA